MRLRHAHVLELDAVEDIAHRLIGEGLQALPASGAFTSFRASLQSEVARARLAGVRGEPRGDSED